MIKVTKCRLVMLLAVKSILSLLSLTLLTVIIHEGAHFITAFILKVPILSFTLLDPQYFAPVFVSSITQRTLQIMVVSYSGGLVAGLLLLTSLIFTREWFKQSLYRWLLGFYIAALAFWQLCQGVLEGAFHGMYVSDATNVLSLSYWVGYAFAFLGMALYWVLGPSVRDLITKEMLKFQDAF